MLSEQDYKNINNMLDKAEVVLTSAEEKTKKKIELICEKIDISEKFVKEVKPIDDELKKLAQPTKAE